MDFYYINSRNERIDLSDYPYLFQEGDLLNYSWSYEASNNRIKNVKKEAAEHSVSVALLPAFEGTKEERMQALLSAANRIFEVFEYDVINNTNGKLYTDTGYYLPCRIMASSKSKWRLGIPFQQQAFKVVSDINSWIKEETKSFMPVASVYAESNLDYPHDYPFDYVASTSGTAYWNIGHYSACDFEMKIYGAVENPTIYINGHEYSVECSLSGGDYLVLNSVDKTIIRVAENGDRMSLLNNRNKDSNIFKQLPPDALKITWNGSFGFDLTALIKRSEPSWN